MPRGNGGIIGPVNTSFSGVWSLTEAQLRRSGGTWPSVYQQAINELSTGSDAVIFGSAADPYFDYTTLLLPGNGTNGAQNNTFLDGSTNNFTITRNGNTTQGTFSPFSQTGWGNYFVANNANALTAATGSGVAFGVGDFCQEFFLYATSYTGTWRIISYASVSTTASMLIQSGAVLGLDTGVGSINTGITLPTNTWFHLVYTRQSSRIRIFVNGVLQYNVADATNYTTSQSVHIGGFPGYPQSWDGYISNARIIKGSVPTAYQTSSTTNGTTIFTPPTSPLTADTGTELLTCQSNRFFDSNTQVTAKTITVSGSPTVVAFSPFNPTASWSAATYGGSGYFDGSGDYLTVANNDALNLGNSDFTIEGWFFSSASFGGLFAKRGSNTVTGIAAYTDGTKIQYLCAIGGSWAVNMLGTANWVFNQWNHFAFVRSGSTFTSYINGVVSATATNSGTIDTNTGGFAIGATAADGAGSATSPFYLGNMRVVKGTAVYTAAFTPPTAPLTAITNTSLLLNFTNAGIYDATSKNDFETVGNAQISTTQSKWGGSSMYFDGTDDRLTNNNANNPLISLGTGDFTIECWTYFTSLANKGVFQISTTAGGLQASQTNTLAVNYDSGGAGWGFYAKNTSITGAGTNPLNAWVHIALVRSGTTTTLYVNGANTISTTSDTTNYTGTYICVGGYYSTSYLFNGYIQDLRITKGYARYTANFTAPTAAFPTL